MKNLRLNIVYTETADFSLLSNVKPNYIDKVKQKTFFEMDEKGTTGAVVSDMEMCLGIPVQMKCNRPYFIFISKFCPSLKKDIILYCIKIENP